MITCDKCGGKVFVDLTFTENRNYESFCLRCGKRTFVGPSNSLYPVFDEYVRSVMAR